MTPRDVAVTLAVVSLLFLAFWNLGLFTRIGIGLMVNPAAFAELFVHGSKFLADLKPVLVSLQPALADLKLITGDLRAVASIASAFATHASASNAPASARATNLDSDKLVEHIHDETDPNAASATV